MLFADDQSLANEDEKKLQKHTNSLNTTCDGYDMKISISQTKAVKVSRTHSKLTINISQTKAMKVSRTHSKLNINISQTKAMKVSRTHSKLNINISQTKAMKVSRTHSKLNINISQTKAMKVSRTHSKLNINISQTKAMKVSRTHSKLNINGTQLQHVTEFKYLGGIFREDGRFNREVETRVQKANNVRYQLAPLLKHPNIHFETKAKLINSIFIPTLTYQCQTWNLTKSLERKITTCEMRCLRRAVNKTRRDMIRNEHIREMVGTTPAHHYIQQQRIKWFGQLKPTNWHTRHAKPGWQASKRKGDQEKLGLQVSKRPSRHTACPLSGHSCLLLIVSFIPPRHSPVQADG